MPLSPTRLDFTRQSLYCAKTDAVRVKTRSGRTAARLGAAARPAGARSSGAVRNSHAAAGAPQPQPW